MSVSNAPRIAEFPVVEEDLGFTGQSLKEAPLRAMCDHVARVYGEAERAQLTGLPALMVSSLYPEVMVEKVAAFSLIQGTPALGQVQELLDKVAEFMSVVSDAGRGDPEFHEALGAMRAWTSYNSDFTRQQERALVDWFFVVPMAGALRENLSWAAHETLRKSDPTNADSWETTYWWHEVYDLCMFVCVYHVGPPKLRKLYTKFASEFAEVFSNLGMPAMIELTGGGRR